MVELCCGSSIQELPIQLKETISSTVNVLLQHDDCLSVIQQALDDIFSRVIEFVNFRSLYRAICVNLFSL